MNVPAVVRPRLAALSRLPQAELERRLRRAAVTARLDDAFARLRGPALVRLSRAAWGSRKAFAAAVASYARGTERAARRALAAHGIEPFSGSGGLPTMREQFAQRVSEMEHADAAVGRSAPPTRLRPHRRTARAVRSSAGGARRVSAPTPTLVSDPPSAPAPGPSAADFAALLERIDHLEQRVAAFGDPAARASAAFGGPPISMQKAADVIGWGTGDALRKAAQRAKPGDPFYALRPGGTGRTSSGAVREDAAHYVKQLAAQAADAYTRGVADRMDAARAARASAGDGQPTARRAARFAELFAREH